MKKLIALAALCLAAFTSQAQLATDLANGVNDLLNTPWTLDTGYGHSVTGMGYNIAYVAIADNFVTTTNATGTVGLSSGLIGGYDALWTSHEHQFNSLNGGFSVTYTGMPLTFIGTSWASNVCVNISGYELVTTAKQGNDVGSITGISVMATVYKFNPTLRLKVGGKYESRNGVGEWNGNDLLGSIELSKSF